MKNASFSGTFTCTSPEVWKWFQDSLDKFEKDKEKALRLFFLMRFGIPLKCSEGEKKILHWEDRHGYSEYHYNDSCFAIEYYSKEHYLQSSMSKDAQSEWLLNMPMKEFRIFGLKFKK